ncbi:MAG TPA: hypothetical protein VD706_00505 [Candidatus Saccharimonadales bacterium]|nr:hypothetical protein [Candidatus Saccharimonadales bacterium]
MTDLGKETFPESLDPVSLERSMHMLGHIWGVNGLEVAIEPGAGASCGPTQRGGIRITLDPQQILEGNPENQTVLIEIPPEVTALFIGGHELGHGRDMMDPEAVLKPRSDAEQFFECLIDDTVIDKRNRLVPLLDSYADDIYGMQMPQDLTDKPKHVQLMYGIRISEVIGDPDIPMDPDVQRIITDLREYEQDGAVFDILATLTDSRTSLSERREIAQRFIWPEYHALLEQDKQDEGDNADSENGDFQGEYEEYQQAVHGHRPESESQDGQPEQSPGQAQEESGSDNEEEGAMQEGEDSGESTQKDNPSKGDGEESGQEQNQDDDEADEGTDAEALAGQIAQVIQEYERLAEQEAGEIDSEAALQAMEDVEEPETDATSQLVIGRRMEQVEELTEILQREMKLDKHEAKDYVYSLEKWQRIIHEVANVFLKLAAPGDVIMSPRYQRRAQSEGVRLHPGAAASLAVQLATGQEQNIWQPVERQGHRQEVTFNGLDFYFLGDRSCSMNEAGKAQAAANTGLCLIEGLQLARHKVARRPGQAHKPDVRTQFIVFGEGAEVLSPLTYEPTGQQKGRIYTELSTPDDDCTHISGALEEVVQGIQARPGRDAIVFVVGDGEFHDFDEAEKIVKALPKSARVIQLIIGKELNEYITSNHEAIRNPEELPAKLYEVLSGYIKQIGLTHDPHTKFWESTAPTVEFHR